MYLPCLLVFLELFFRAIYFTLGVASHLPFNGGMSLFKVLEFCSVFLSSDFYFDFISYFDGLNTCFQPFPNVLQDHDIIHQGLFLCVKVDVVDLLMFPVYSRMPLLFGL